MVTSPKNLGILSVQIIFNLAIMVRKLTFLINWRLVSKFDGDWDTLMQEMSYSDLYYT